MKVYRYSNYDEYVAIQTKGNHEKENWVYARKEVIDGLVRKYHPNAGSVICHGTRCGAEQKFFKDILGEGCHVIGTEISDTAVKYPMTVRWDFSKPALEWVGAFDVVYSNAFDHCLDPVETLHVWGTQLRSGGRLFLEYAQSQSIGNAADPLDATESEIRELLLQTGYEIVDEYRERVRHRGVVFVAKRKEIETC